MTQALDVRKGGGEVMPIDPTDAKAWELVGSVLGWMGDNSCYNYSEAFRQLAVAPASFHRAVKRPFVQGRLADRISALDAAVAKILDMRRPARMTSSSPGLRRRLPAQGRRHREVVEDAQGPHLKMDFAFTGLGDRHGVEGFVVGADDGVGVESEDVPAVGDGAATSQPGSWAWFPCWGLRSTQPGRSMPFLACCA